MESREASVDFQRRGSVGQILNHWIPFFNASIGGIDKLARSLTRGTTAEKQAAWVRASLMITIPSIAAWLSHRDEDWYQRLPRYEKNMYWHVKTGQNIDDAGITHDVIMRYPKPFELGLIFGSFFERFLDYAYGEDPEAMKSWGEQFMSTVVPSFQQIVPPISAAFQAQNNYDAWRQKQIVKGQAQKLPARLQYSENTSTTARMLGDVFGASPLKIDFYIRGAFGGLGRITSDALGAGIDVVSDRWDSDRLPARELIPGIPIRENLIGLRAFVKTTPSSFDSYSEDFFGYVNKAEVAHTEAQWTQKGRIPKVELARDIEKTAVWVGIYPMLREAATKVGEVTQHVKTIQMDPTGRLTDKERRLMVDELYVKRGQIMESVVKQIRELLGDEQRMNKIKADAKKIASQLRED